MMEQFCLGSITFLFPCLTISRSATGAVSQGSLNKFIYNTYSCAKCKPLTVNCDISIRKEQEQSMV